MSEPSPILASGVRVEHCIAVATADLMAPEYWRATDTWCGHEIVSGYGDTPELAIADLERITAWRRN